MGYTYSLRVEIAPDYQTEEKFEQLLAFCKKAKIDDVQFFTSAEELNNGHMTMEEAKPWLDMLKSFIPRLREAGIGVSLNPWHTTLHTDRGRSLKPGQDFVTMTDYQGRQGDAIACPLGENFREYLRQLFTAYAELGFDVIWLDDDFRLHNHAPLAWGGCFCQLHMKAFEQRLGRPITREEFVKNMTAEGAPTPERIAWLDTMRQTMIDYGHLFDEIIHRVAPNTRIGLMSSAPENHAIEGRDWAAVFKALSGNTRPLSRAHMPAYLETTGWEYCLNFQRVSRLTAAVVPENVEKWPELESYPYSTFAKSHAFTKFQMETSLSLCAEGLTMNIYDVMGNGIMTRERNDVLLAQVKPYLEGVRALGAKTKQEAGICVLVDPDTVYHTHCDGGEGPGALWPWQTFWAEYLSAFGFANRVDTKAHAGEMVALNGQILRSMDAAQIRTLAAEHRLLLDADSVEIMLEKGCGDLVHVTKAVWHPLNCGYQTFEEVVGTREVYGMTHARMSAQALSETTDSGDYLELTYDIPVEEVTCLKNANGERVGAGVVVTEGAVIVPYGHFQGRYDNFLVPVRRALLDQLLTGVAKVRDCQYVTINHFPVEQGQMILLSNFATDSFDQPELELPFQWSVCRQVDRKTGSLSDCEAVHTDCGAQLPGTLPALSTACYVFS